MKKEITIGQLLSVAVTLLIAIVTGWVTLNNKVSSHDVQIKSLQVQQDKVERVLDRIELTLIDIRLLLQNKKDR